MYTLEEWSALSNEEKLANLADKPEGGEEPKKDGTAEPTAAELKTQLAEVNKRITEMERTHKQEVDGIAFDLRREREIRQELEKQLREKGEAVSTEDPLKDKADDEYITVKQMRDILKGQADKERKREVIRMQDRIAEKMDTDEERMIKLTAETSDAYPVTFEDAMKAFAELAKKDKSLWDDVNREALRQGGRPAEKAYRIALLSAPELSKLVTVATRNKIIEELNKKPQTPTKLGGGGAGEGKLDLSKMSDKDLLEAVKNKPTEVDAALGGPK